MDGQSDARRFIVDSPRLHDGVTLDCITRNATFGMYNGMRRIDGYFHPRRIEMQFKGIASEANITGSDPNQRNKPKKVTFVGENVKRDILMKSSSIGQLKRKLRRINFLFNSHKSRYLSDGVWSISATIAIIPSFLVVSSYVV